MDHQNTTVNTADLQNCPCLAFGEIQVFEHDHLTHLRRPQAVRNFDFPGEQFMLNTSRTARATPEPQGFRRLCQTQA